MKKLIVLIVLSLPLLTYAGQSATPPKKQAEEFFKLIMAGKYEKALDEIWEGTGIKEFKPQAVQVMKTQTSSILKVYGKPIGYEVVHEEELSPSLVRLVYLLKFEANPTDWEMYFYKVHGDWGLRKIFFSDQLKFVGAKK